jgi:hypothetical protein
MKDLNLSQDRKVNLSLYRNLPIDKNLEFHLKFLLTKVHQKESR